MRLPVIQGKIARRILANYRADPAVVQRLLPAPFRPKLHRGSAIAGICLIRLEHIRPAWLPGPFGIASENAAHRIAVQWTDDTGAGREGVFIPRRDTGSWLNQLAGGRVFPGEHHAAQFSVTEQAGRIRFAMRSRDGAVEVKLVGHETDALPPASCFCSLAEASAFFEGGSLGYSVTRGGQRLHGLTLRTSEWRVSALEVEEIHSSYFADAMRFPACSVQFDHALLMRDIPHQWHQAGDLYL
jgi:hypothetical protein